jgi:hypothetical protein
MRTLHQDIVLSNHREQDRQPSVTCTSETADHTGGACTSSSLSLESHFLDIHSPQVTLMEEMPVVKGPGHLGKL